MSKKTKSESSLNRRHKLLHKHYDRVYERKSKLQELKIGDEVDNL